MDRGRGVASWLRGSPVGVCRTRVLPGVKGVVGMEEREAPQVAQAVWRALQAGDWDAAAGYLHEDFVQEWPQSGERILGRANAIAINQNFPGGLPRTLFGRTLAGGDLAVLQVELTYADGSRYLGVSVFELREGKVVKQTDYFAQPFQAPQWRAQWVQRM
jgi:SnoaL-like protein